MRKTVKIAGIILLAAAIATPALAYGPGRGRGHYTMGYRGGGPFTYGYYGRGYDNLTAEQRGQLDKLYQKFYDETAQLRIDLRAKRAELDVILNSSNPDPEKAKALQKEIGDLRTKLTGIRLNYRLEAGKISPNARFGGGYREGFGPPKGHGRPMRVYGPGACWH